MNPPEESLPPRIDRRVALKWISAAAATPALGGLALRAADLPLPSATGYGPDPDMTKVYQPGDVWPLTFSDAHRRLATVLCDLLLPAEGSSPGATTVGVPDFLDEWISAPYPDQKRDRQLLLDGFDALDALAGKRGGTAFVSLPGEDQLAICNELAKAAKSNPKEFPASFFLKLRDLVAGGFYTTPAGMHDLGYRGNLASIEWTGPPPEVLEALGLTAQA